MAGPTIVVSILAALVGLWVTLGLAVQTLLVLMCLDMVTGILRALIDGELSSDIGYQGVTRKALTLAIVVTGHIIEPVIGVQLGALVATFYAAIEVISILENAAAVGVPIPAALRDALEILQRKAGNNNAQEDT